jgi:4-hydroxy-2-oxovalerate aldolase
METARPTILECTLRDGSYAINFQFTAHDTEVIAGGLDELGFEYIEVGHGIGLGASEKSSPAAESDAGYMKAAAKAVTRGKWGMFCIPGIARLDHLDLAIDHGMGFVRVGTEVADVPNSRPFIEKAKKAGMFVCANFMKSYACPPEQFAERVVESEGYGADCVYIVDSAGGMFPSDIDRYIEAVRARTQVMLGFHGHNNLGLAVANSIMCAERGVHIIDTSLQGFGRSSGNCSTEQFLCAMARRGKDLGIDAIRAMDLGERHINPLITARGLSSIDIVAGMAQFHSSYMGTIREFAGKYGVDPRHLIIAVCARDKVSAPRDVVDEEAKRLHDEGFRVDGLTARFQLNRYFGAEQK